MAFRLFFIRCFALLMAAPPAVWGCDIPVYQYALENWTPDDYQVFVFSSAEPAAGAQTALARIADAGQDQASNLTLTEVDLGASLKAFESALWKAQAPKNPTPPWVVVRNPLSLPPHVSIWSGPLTPDAAAGVLDSPARQAIARQLKSGALAVWLLLGCGDAEKDEAALTRLRAALKTAEEETAKRLGDARLKDAPAMADCIVRVDRADGEEAFLVHSLLGTEPDLRAYTEPMVFPVYGRGRVLYALVGAGINRDTVVDTALFLAGECSCEVKAGNPGVDLLIGVEWGESDPAAPAAGYCEVSLPALSTPR